MAVDVDIRQALTAVEEARLVLRQTLVLDEVDDDPTTAIALTAYQCQLDDLAKKLAAIVQWRKRGVDESNTQPIVHQIEHMSDRAKLNEIRRRHSASDAPDDYQGRVRLLCRECRVPWPCITARLAHGDHG